MGFSCVGMGLWPLAVSARFYRSVRTAWCYASDVELCCNGAVSKVIATLKRALVDLSTATIPKSTISPPNTSPGVPSRHRTHPQEYHLATEHIPRRIISPQNTSPGVPSRHRTHPRSTISLQNTSPGVPSRHRTHPQEYYFATKNI